MDELAKKISEYQLFNYLFPGVIFCFLVTRLTSVNLLVPDVLSALFFYYFVGLTISRIGSLLIEPLLQKIKFVTYSPYKDFLKAVEKDPKIDTMVEASNTFRTLSAGLLAVTVVYATTKMPNSLKNINGQHVATFILLLVLSILFLASYRKQVGYVRKRVER